MIYLVQTYKSVLMHHSKLSEVYKLLYRVFTFFLISSSFLSSPKAVCCHWRQLHNQVTSHKIIGFVWASRFLSRRLIFFFFQLLRLLPMSPDRGVKLNCALLKWSLCEQRSFLFWGNTLMVLYGHVNHKDRGAGFNLSGHDQVGSWQAKQPCRVLYVVSYKLLKLCVV